jgi:O-antigen/teichoic acid export membrane protein/SAM-dependent methyltransferase
MKGPIARSTLRTSVVLSLRVLVQTATLLIVARLLGPHDYGAFAGMAALAVMLGTLSTFGTHLVLLAEVSRDPARRSAVLSCAVPTTLLCGSTLLALYLLITLTLLHDVGIAYSVLIALGITELLLQPLLSLPSAEHQGHGRIATSQLLMTLPLALRLIAAAIVWLLHTADPLRDFAYGYLGASMLALTLATLSTRNAWPALRVWRLPQIAELRHAAGYAVLNLTATGPAELDKTLALKLLPLAVAGVYAAGARVIGALTLPVIAMMLSAMPRLFRDGQTDRIRSNQLLRWVFAASLGYSLLLAVALWIAAPLFDLLFGPRYHGLSDIIRWLTLAVPGMALRIAAGSTLMALGRPWMRVSFELGGLAVLSTAALLLAPRWVLSGLPLALACSEWSMAILGWLLIDILRRSIGQMPRKQDAILNDGQHLLCPYCGSHSLHSLGKLPDSHWFAGRSLSQPLLGGALYRCRDCQLKFRYPACEMAIYQELYDNAAISTWPANNTRPDWDLIVNYISSRLPQGGRVLDFGCYTGGLLTRLGPAYERHGVEINKAAATVASEKACTPVWSAIDDIPKELRFNVIIASDVIEHMQHPEHLIDGLFTLLEDGGALIITTGDAENRLWNRFGANWWYCFYPEHITFLSEAWLGHFSRSRDLSIERCEKFRYYHFSIARRFVEAVFTCCYGLFPSIYLHLSGMLRKVFGHRAVTSVPGNGVSADHLFIVLTQKECTNAHL